MSYNTQVLHELLIFTILLTVNLVHQFLIFPINQEKLLFSEELMRLTFEYQFRKCISSTVKNV